MWAFTALTPAPKAVRISSSFQPTQGFRPGALVRDKYIGLIFVAELPIMDVISLLFLRR
jgi:hypothetical protein